MSHMAWESHGSAPGERGNLRMSAAFSRFNSSPAEPSGPLVPVRVGFPRRSLTLLGSSSRTATGRASDLAPCWPPVRIRPSSPRSAAR
jgi:hypothetical protein